MFQPVIPVSGLGGWNFLQRTYDKQFENFTKSAQIQRDVDYFKETVGTVTTAETFVKDRRLMKVALIAFGLKEDIGNTYFIKKVLEDGTKNDDALANKFANKSYKKLSAAFGFGPSETLKIKSASFVEDIISKFEASEFERAAGEKDPAIRLALYAKRTIPELATTNISNDAKWFSIMGDPPLRQLFETALNLPKEFGQVNLDQQLSVFKEKAAKLFGTSEISSFSTKQAVEELNSKYLVREQINTYNSSYSSGSIALTLLRGF